MHDILHAWAAQYRVPAIAIADLLNRFGVGYETLINSDIPLGASEAAVQQRVRMGAAAQGIVAWRNNSGAMMDDNGNMVRFGLCNDTAALNKKFKSPDLVGVKPVLITQAMVGSTIGQAWFRECKEQSWKWGGTEREVAQLAFGTLAIKHGADFAFTTGAI